MRLKLRLPLFFLVVVSLSSALPLVVARRSAESMFKSFVFSGDSEKAKVYAGLLGEYYRQNGGWTGAQSFLEELPLFVSTTIDTKIHGFQDSGPLSAIPVSTLKALIADRIVVADIHGVIVADTAGRILGTMHPAMHLLHGIPVMAQFQNAGTVLVGSMIDSALTGEAGRFLGAFTLSLAVSTLASAGVALVVGLAFAARITKPLGELASAAKNVTASAAFPPVDVRGNDELSELSTAFNEMTGELRRLDAAKKQVIADSAHELRTPLTLIQGMLEGMIDGILPLDAKTLKSVHDETLRLARLVDTLRELEIIESGELELAVAGIELKPFLREAVALFAPAAAAKSIRLSCSDEGGDAPSGPLVAGDYLRLGQVVYNLLANAIKYSQSGGTVQVRMSEGPGALAGFSVDDSGPGIGPEERPRVFERFYRTDKSRSSDSGGRGLGLAIAAEIVKAHGGTICADSSDLGGARFTVMLPRFTPR